ncbi:MAG: hypothetical protein AB7Q23_11050 [Hyphomonadaceae bacterium]
MNAVSAILGDWASNKIGRVVDYVRFAYVQRVSGFTVSDQPEFEAACVPFFLECLAVATSYLEFGAGGSTVLAAMHGMRMTTVESDKHFLAAVKRKLTSLGRFDRQKQDLLAVDIGVTEAWGAPLMRTPTPARVARWRRYPSAPWAAMEHLPGPHLVLVDGRFRVACALSAARFLIGREGAILIDDYMDREHYYVVERHLERVRNVGRMALFRVRPDVDRVQLDADIEAHYADWR